MFLSTQASVVQRTDNAIHLIKFTPTKAFYTLDKVIRSLNNWGQTCSVIIGSWLEKPD